MTSPLQLPSLPEPLNPFLYIIPRQVWHFPLAHSGPSFGPCFSNQPTKVLKFFLIPQTATLNAESLLSGPMSVKSAFSVIPHPYYPFDACSTDLCPYKLENSNNSFGAPFYGLSSAQQGMVRHPASSNRRKSLLLVDLRESRKRQCHWNSGRGELGT